MTQARRLIDPPGSQPIGLAADDPAVLFGEALFETMRADGARIAFLGRHLSRLAGSADALGWESVADEARVRALLARALGGASGGAQRVRLTASRSGVVLLEISPMPNERLPTALSLVGRWLPGRFSAEHKTTSYVDHRLAQTAAESAGCGHALLLDARGRLGETANANIVCALDSQLLTPPVAGILPGVARGVLVDSGIVLERNLASEAWGRADELIAVSALRGAAPILAVDGRAVGNGQAGAGLAAVRAALAAASLGET